MTFKTFVDGIVGAMNDLVIPAIFAFAFAAFIYGVVKYYFIGGGSDESRAQGRQFVFWGILGMVILFSIWGVVNMLLSTFGITPH
ncbi:hypothetical protein KGM48_03825 [Patescibacteria group bacterium]|nr:hypothetical protein [Patescibacteria group bacterium]